MRMARLTVMALTLAGCAATPTVPDTSDAESINTISMTCQSPYELAQDCSGWSGATRTVMIDGFEVKVAGSADGKVILVMDAHLMANTFSDIGLLNSPTNSKASNDSFYAVRSLMTAAGIQIQRVRPLRSFGNVNGYILELTSDGYTVLKHHSPG